MASDKMKTLQAQMSGTTATVAASASRGKGPIEFRGLEASRTGGSYDRAATVMQESRHVQFRAQASVHRHAGLLEFFRGCKYVLRRILKSRNVLYIAVTLFT